MNFAPVARPVVVQGLITSHARQDVYDGRCAELKALPRDVARVNPLA